MTWICYRGIELSARIQQVLLGAEVFILGLFAVVAFVKVYGSHPPAGSIKPSLSWINPFAMNFADLVVALLLAVFIYWGWDSGVAVNEESEDPAEGPGKAAVVSTILLVLIYVVVTAAAQSFHGVGFLTNEANQEDVLNALGTGVLGSTPGQAADHRRAHLGVGLDADDDPADRPHDAVDGALESGHEPALARAQALPDPDRLDARLRRCSRSSSRSSCCCSPKSVLEDSLTAIGFPICFYYGFTGVACGFYYRHELTKSARNLLLLGLGPLLGGLMLFGIGIKAAFYYGHAENVSSKPILGITLPLWMGIGGMLLGGVIMLASRPFFREFFARKTETAPPGLLEQPPPTGPVPERVEF